MTIQDLEKRMKELIREFSENELKAYHEDYISEDELYSSYSRKVLGAYDIPQALSAEWFEMSHLPAFSAIPEEIDAVYWRDGLPAGSAEEHKIGEFTVQNPEVLNFEDLKPNVEYKLHLVEYGSHKLQNHQASFWMIADDHAGILEGTCTAGGYTHFKAFPDKPAYDKVCKFKDGMPFHFPDYNRQAYPSGDLVYKYYQGVGYIEGYQPFECVLISDPDVHPDMLMVGALEVIEDHPRWDAYRRFTAETGKQYSKEKAACIEWLKSLSSEE